MPTLRQDPTTGAWSVLSGDRGHRPVRLVTPQLDATPAACPFCPGNEGVTMPTLAGVDGPDGWRVRAFPNRFPGLRIEDDGAVAQQPPYVSVGGFGCHEVIAESPLHDVPLWEQPGQLRLAMAVAAARLADLWRDPRLSHVTWFRNHGALAGASQPHSHAQIVGGAVIPARVLEMTRRMGAWASSHSRDLLGAMVDRDLADGARVIGRVGDVVVVAPYAPAASWEQWLVPLEGGPRFHEASAATVAQLADAMEAALRALYTVAPPPAYNAVLYTAPRGGEAGFRWHVRLLPRRVALGGYELMSGGAMLHAAPEWTAAAIRGAWAPADRREEAGDGAV
jgi:UDPglucose--hexose-1-phosphate uridylyltransferase